MEGTPKLKEKVNPVPKHEMPKKLKFMTPEKNFIWKKKKKKTSPTKK
jgi:hypothetical protein